MKKIFSLCFFLLLAGVSTHAQIGNLTMQFTFGAPSGKCPNTLTEDTDLTNNNLYGCGSNGSWFEIAGGGGGSGTVTSVASGTGLTGGPITTSGTLSIDSTVATLTGTQTLTNKTVDGVTPTVFGYVDATSSIQTQLNAKQATLTGTGLARNSGASAELSGDCATSGSNAVTCSDTNGVAFGSWATATLPVVLDPTKYIYFFDDFLGWSGTTNTNSIGLASVAGGLNLGVGGIGTAWFTFNAGTGIVGAVSTWDSGTYGDLLLTSGTTSANYAGVLNVLNANYVLNNSTFDLLFSAKILSTASTSDYVGFFDVSGLESAQTDSIGIGYDTNQSDTSWMLVCRASSTATRTAIAGTLDTNYHKFHMYSTVAGTINATVDGGAVSSCSTNVPSAALVFGLISGTRTTAAKTMHVDYVRGYIAVSR